MTKRPRNKTQNTNVFPGISEVKEEQEDVKNQYKVRVSVNLLNRRREPNIEGEIIQRLKKDETLVIIEEQKDLKENVWGRIIDGGWVALRFCQKIEGG